MKVYIILFIIASIIVLFFVSDKITIVDIIISLCMTYISDKIFAFIGEYITFKREKRRFELILQKIEKKYLECQDTQ